jgi:predicted enzyme related to lactoylglutathione lyase
MGSSSGLFAWYELLTTDIAAAQAFYAGVVGWDAQDASKPDLAYTRLSAGQQAVAGLMELPPEARRLGAMPRWMGYVGVDDVDAAAQKIERLGGAIYVPPTTSNIGRIAVVADPQGATFGLIRRGPPDQPAGAPPADDDRTRRGQVGWHELVAADSLKALAFYQESFAWQKLETEDGPATYRLFGAGGRSIGGMLDKRPIEPVPFWLFYFNVDDLDAASARVEAAGGQLFEGPFAVPGGSWIARYVDPQGAIFALQGGRDPSHIVPIKGAEVSWSTEWRGISTRGRMVIK